MAMDQSFARKNFRERVQLQIAPWWHGCGALLLGQRRIRALFGGIFASLTETIAQQRLHAHARVWIAPATLLSRMLNVRREAMVDEVRRGRDPESMGPGDCGCGGSSEGWKILLQESR